MKNAPHFGFDMDGTVIDTFDFFENASMQSFEENGLHLSQADFRKAFGIGKRTVAWLHEMGIYDQKLIDSVIGTRNKIMISLLETRAAWMPGAPETLEELKRRQGTVIIVTNACDAFIEAVRRRLPEIDDFITNLTGPESHAFQPKPSPGGIHRAVVASGREAHEFIFVGDQLFDQKAARNAGVKFCALHGDHTHPEALENADYRISHLSELLEIS